MDNNVSRGGYDEDRVLKRIGRVLIEMVALEDVTREIMTAIREELDLQSVGILLENDLGIHTHAEGFAEGLEQDAIALLQETGGALLVQERMPEGSAKELLKKHGVAIGAPLKLKTRNLATLLLGPKRSGEPFGADEISFLEILASEIAIGIENAESYERMKILSKELEVWVHERTEELLASQQKELAKAKEVTRLKDEFVFLAVHELRTPVIAIRGFLELTESARENFPKDIRDNLAAMAQASTHLNQLINDILEIARSDRGTVTVDMQPQVFEPILEDVLKETKSLMAEKKLTLSVKVQRMPRVLCDVAKVKEVLENLISNAVKYNREGGVIEIVVFRPPEESSMLFEIRDTGFGIPKDQQDKIFQKFFRAVTEETQETLGTGLGLFVTRMLVERMGGTLTFSSVEHEGTTFAFTLPLAEFK